MANPFTQVIYQLGYSIRVVVTTGQTFTADVSTSAQQTVTIPGGAQLDVNYIVYVVPTDVGAAVWPFLSLPYKVTLKSVTQFTVLFAAAPPSGGQYDWMLLRSS